LLGVFIGIVLSVAALVIFAGSAASLAADEFGTKQSIIQQGDAMHKIAIVQIDGIIDDKEKEKFIKVLNAVEKDSQVCALVVQIDTPGGSASASDEMYHRLLQLKKSWKDAGKNIPVVVSMQGMATSGGYYVSCAADYLVAERGTLTGNIGVLFPRFNVSQFFGDHGLKESTLTATPPEGRSFKNAGSMFHATDAEDEQYLQGLVDGIMKCFMDAVNTGRGARLNIAQFHDIFSGKAFLADDAMQRGLIDQIGYPDDAYAYAISKSGVANPQLVRYSERPSLLETLMSSQSNLSGAKAQGNVTVNGVNFNANDLARLIESRPLLLWRGN